jgi:hypothetical protein
VLSVVGPSNVTIHRRDSKGSNSPEPVLWCRLVKRFIHECRSKLCVPIFPLIDDVLLSIYRSDVGSASRHPVREKAQTLFVAKGQPVFAVLLFL